MGLFQKAVDRVTDTKMTQKRRKRMIVFVAVITLLSMVTSTVAWFSVNTFAGVDTLDVHISVSAQLKVSMEDHGKDLNQYVKIITNEMIDGYLGSKANTRLADLKLDPVTSTDGVRMVNRSGAVREPNRKSYLEFECYFIATEPMWVHLTTESSDIAGDRGTQVTSASPAPQSEVTQCTRVSFSTDSNGTATYEPNKAGAVNSLNTFDIGTPIYAKTIKASTLKISKSNHTWTTHVAYNVGTSTAAKVMYPASHAADGNWYNCVAAAETTYGKNDAAGTAVTPSATSDYVYKEQLNVKNDGDSGTVTQVQIAVNYPESVSDYIRIALVPADESGTEETGATIEANTYAPTADTHVQLTNGTTEGSTTITANTGAITVGTGTLTAQEAKYYNLYVWFEGQDSQCFDSNAGQTLNGLSFTVTGNPA